MTTANYDDIRPYTDAEVPAAMQRIASWNLFPQVVRYIYPDLSAEEARHKLQSVSSVHELQSTFMNDAIKRIIASTATEFTFSGLGYLRRGQNYLFVSNHRDITLDAFLLQHLLLETKGDTSYIVFGDNLISSEVLGDLFKSNKLIQMQRGGTPRAFYDSLHHLSCYIRHLIVEEHQSVWIAQRNGRSKDGVDNTAPAVMKMLMLSDKSGAREALAALHIVPLSISYEWDPCDVMKANELYLRSKGDYQKAKDEDFNSVVTGIIAPKGHIHMSIGRPLTEAELPEGRGEAVAEQVATLLDTRIQRNYRLMPTNYLAYDMLNNSARYRNRYSAPVRHQFVQRMEALPDKARRQIFVEMYANPVLSMLRFK